MKYSETFFRFLQYLPHFFWDSSHYKLQAPLKMFSPRASTCWLFTRASDTPMDLQPLPNHFWQRVPTGGPEKGRPPFFLGISLCSSGEHFAELV